MPSEFEVRDPWWDDDTDEWDMCTVCDGLGTDKWDDEELCWNCTGEGMVPKIS